MRKVKSKVVVRDAGELASVLGGVDSGGGAVGDRSALQPLECLRGKVASELEELRWVKNNIGSAVVPEDAPSGAAWTLLMDLRGDGAFRVDFWKTMFMKLLPRNAGDGDDGGE